MILDPQLLDLMEHEKVIEQGLATFVDVGMALLAIKVDKKYRLAGYGTFEEYCSRRWAMGERRARQLVTAATMATNVLAGDSGTIVPTRESQVRALAPLRDEPEKVREVWAEAVEEANGEQPTAEQVKTVVERHRLSISRKEHPAPFSDAILEVIAEHVPAGSHVLDPFAGVGRVHRLREMVSATTVGVEIEPEWAATHPDTIEGDAQHLDDMFEPSSFDAVVTSPTYGNRMADHHDARDDSVRPTYKHTLGRDLAEANTGQLHWGDAYRAFHSVVWSQAITVLRPGGTFTLNIKNHIRNGEIQRVAEWHIGELICQGLTLIALDMVPTRGLMAGQNHGVRVTHEVVATFRKEDR